MLLVLSIVCYTDQCPKEHTVKDLSKDSLVYLESTLARPSVSYWERVVGWTLACGFLVLLNVQDLAE